MVLRRGAGVVQSAEYKGFNRPKAISGLATKGSNLDYNPPLIVSIARRRLVVLRHVQWAREVGVGIWVSIARRRLVVLRRFGERNQSKARWTRFNRPKAISGLATCARGRGRRRSHLAFQSPEGD